MRGASAPGEELAYILDHSDSAFAVVQDAATLDKVVAAAGASHGGAYAAALSRLRAAVVLCGQPSESARAALAAASGGGCAGVSYGEGLERGRATQAVRAAAFEPVPLAPSDTATLVYTSGTTGGCCHPAHRSPLTAHRPARAGGAKTLCAPSAAGHPKGVVLTHANLTYQVSAPERV